ncbi:MAG: 4Fe-4S dicluster domain-containing protein, partial [Desulfobacteraceae bacterium]|nr:4Fe-4S dicluster domain-containing protein [Desulfobacteraceae bacterium]
MEVQRLMDQCVECGICRKDCEFLRRNGNPGSIIKAGEEGPGDGRDLAFECSLCGLCTAACPMGVDPASAFLQ